MNSLKSGSRNSKKLWKPRYFNLVSLGCPKNRVDSEKILGAITDRGLEHTLDQSQAEIIVINTCAFIQPAVEESIATILDSAEANPDAFLIVAGCMPLRYRQSLRDLLPEVDLFITPDQIGIIWDLVRSCNSQKKNAGAWMGRPLAAADNGVDFKPQINLANLSDSSVTVTCDGASTESAHFSRILSTPGYAYLRIADGCNHGCTFCAIPTIRGKLKSEPMDDLVMEATWLADSGVREVILIAQDLTSYGRDLGYRNGLVRLLDKLQSISGIEWIRLMYLYPSGISADLIRVIRDSTVILPYVDAPIQHISENVLRSMGRRWSERQIRKMIEDLRSQIPGIVIRTTLMVGFPTETESDFTMLTDFVKEIEIDHIGVFAYFQEEGSPAEKLGDPIPRKVKNARARKIRSLHSQFVKKRLKKRVGSIETAIVEGFSEETDLLLEGRTWDQAPEIDGKLYITDGDPAVGEIVRVLITETRGIDLFGEIRRQENSSIRHRNET